MDALLDFGGCQLFSVFCRKILGKVYDEASRLWALKARSFNGGRPPSIFYAIPWVRPKSTFFSDQAFRLESDATKNYRFLIESLIRSGPTDLATLFSSLFHDFP